MDYLIAHLSLYTTGQPTSQHCLLSLIGKLLFATKVIPAGRIFLRWLLDHAHSVEHLDNSLLLTQEAFLDTGGSPLPVPAWNGTVFFLDPTWSSTADLPLYTDVSSEIGYDAYWNGRWLNQHWPPHLLHHSTDRKELYAIVIALW